MQEMLVRSLSREGPLEKEMAACCSIPAWETPWTEKPGWLQAMGLKRVGHDLATNAPPVLSCCWTNYQGNQGRCEELIWDLTPLPHACLQNYWVPLSVNADPPRHQTSHACERGPSNLLISEREVFIIRASDRHAEGMPEWKAVPSVPKEIVTIICSSSWCK